MDTTDHLFSDAFSLADLQQLLDSGKHVALNAETITKIQHCRDYLDNRINNGGDPMYGINTGFGALCNTVIPNSQLEELQTNLVLSHACGMGDEVPGEIVRIMLLLKAKSLSYGNSGAQVATVQRLLDFYNEGYTPLVYEQGSLGASGDLAPLAHLSLPIIGIGEVRDKNGNLIDIQDVNKKHNWTPIKLQAKEGLALLNGTQFMNAYASFCVLEAEKLLDWAEAIAALSIDAFDGRLEPFHPEIQNIRRHQGQKTVAKSILAWLEGSEIASRAKLHVQDPYSFRCIPQVHGASRDALDYIKGTVERELNAATDNPTVFPDSDEVISAGNFHGQPLALVLDHLALALAEIGSISERRCYKLISGTRGLPAFLAKDPGLHSGLMIPQYTAASIVSQNKQLCFPASCDSIDSSNGQEDHVSMGANAATKALRVVNNVRRILGIELLTATSAMAFRAPMNTSKSLNNLLLDAGKNIAPGNSDRYMHPEMRRMEEFLQKHLAADYKN
jgi:histidine ammonia-lyase